MDNLGEIILAFGVLLTLASFGVATLAAFGLMALLGLVTEMSFRRNFFIAFGVALFVPIVLGATLIGVLQDDQVQDEISAELRDALPSSGPLVEEIESSLGPTGDEQRALADGTMTPEEIEQRLEQRLQRVLPDADVQIDEDGMRITMPDDSVNIRID